MKRLMQPTRVTRVSRTTTGSDPGLFAMIVIVSITIFAFIFLYFVSAIE
jgi:hypothetical protein